MSKPNLCPSILTPSFELPDAPQFLTALLVKFCENCDEQPAALMGLNEQCGPNMIGILSAIGFLDEA
jgi:hypothetical protein